MKLSNFIKNLDEKTKEKILVIVGAPNKATVEKLFKQIEKFSEQHYDMISEIGDLLPHIKQLGIEVKDLERLCTSDDNLQTELNGILDEVKEKLESYK